MPTAILFDIPRPDGAQYGIAFPCEVDVGYSSIFPESDAEVHPVGYALALELLGAGTRTASTADRLVIPQKMLSTTFGREFDFEAA